MSDENKEKPSTTRNLLKGVLAGAIGGLAGTAAKSVAEKIFPPRTHGEPEPPEVLAQKVAGGDLTEGEKEAAGEALHWAFGSLAGAAYGGLVSITRRRVRKKARASGWRWPH